MKSTYVISTTVTVDHHEGDAPYKRDVAMAIREGLTNKLMPQLRGKIVRVTKVKVDKP